jgi:CheY-like chemotaxis protein
MDSNNSPRIGSASNAPKNAAPRRHARVLIAEDDWAFRDLLLLAFEDDGYDVVAVGDGASLLDVLGTSMLPKSDIKPFDLVVSDLRMPGWAGLVALENLSRSPQVPPVVVITAFGSEDVHRRAEQAGAVAVLDKPFDVAELTALSRRVLSRQPA